MTELRLRPKPFSYSAISAAVQNALRDQKFMSRAEELARIRDDSALTDKKRGPVRGTLGWGEIAPVVPVEVVSVSIEHGILDYESFPPVAGATSAILEGQITANQVRVPPFLSFQAAAILPRSATMNAYHNAAPPSSWTDLMRRHVQALYGSFYTEAEYRTNTTGADVTITYLEVAPGVDVTLGCWWGGTTALMRIGLFRYVFLLFRPDSIELFSTGATVESEEHRTWLITKMGSLSAEEIRFEETAILAGIRPLPPSGVIYTRPVLDGPWTGIPMSYGWQFFDQYPGSAGNYDVGQLEAKAVCLAGGSGGIGVASYTHTVAIDFDGTDFNVTDTTVTHADDASLAPGIGVMQLLAHGMLTRFGTGGSTPDDSTFPIMGHYDSMGAWSVETYSSASGNTPVEERVNNRRPCTGSAAGRAGRWNHTYHAGASLSSLGDITTGAIGTVSQGGESSPYGNASSTSHITIPNPGFDPDVWPQSNYPVDNCGDRPDDFYPTPCGGDDNPIPSYQHPEYENETLVVRGGAYSGTHSGWASMLPVRGEAGAWCVTGGEYRVGVQIRDTPLKRRASHTYNGRTMERGSSPTNYCTGSEWKRMSVSIAWSSDGPFTLHPESTATHTEAVRVGAEGIVQLFAGGGTTVPIPGGGGLVPIRPGGGYYDPSQPYANTLWDNFANPLFELEFNPPVSFSSYRGVVCFTEEPNNPPLAPLHWPEPYAGTFEPAGENWVFIGYV